MGDVVAGGDVEDTISNEAPCACHSKKGGHVDAADALMGWRQGLALIAGSPG